MTTSPVPVVLDVKGLRKRYGELEAVRGVSFQIREGETYGLLGPNGAGKTTLIGIITSTYPARRAAELPPVDALRFEM